MTLTRAMSIAIGFTIGNLIWAYIGFGSDLTLALTISFNQAVVLAYASLYGAK